MTQRTKILCDRLTCELVEVFCSDKWDARTRNDEIGAIIAHCSEYQLNVYALRYISFRTFLRCRRQGRDIAIGISEMKRFAEASWFEFEGFDRKFVEFIFGKSQGYSANSDLAEELVSIVCDYRNGH